MFRCNLRISPYYGLFLWLLTFSHLLVAMPVQTSNPQQPTQTSEHQQSNNAISTILPANSSQTRFPRDIQKILDNGKLRIAMYFEDVPPFFMTTQSGEFIGIDVVLSKNIAELLGVEVEFLREAKTYDQIVDLVDQRNADIAISVLSNTLERAMRVNFSKSYVKLYHVLLINRLKFAKWQKKYRKYDRQPRKILNHTDINIAVIAGSAYVNFAKRDYPQAHVVPFTSLNEAVDNVIQGHVIAMLYDQVEINNWHLAHPEGGLNLQTTILKDRKDTIAFAVHRDDTHLLTWLNLYLEKKQMDGSLAQLLQYYLYTDEWRKTNGQPQISP